MYSSYSILSSMVPAILFCVVDVDASPPPGLIQERQLLSAGEQYCSGSEGICSYSGNLLLDCNGFSEQGDQKQWYECICGNGYVSTHQECLWCEEALNLTVLSFDLESQSSFSAGCSSASATIAPVPSSILASVSAWNSSYSGFLATATLTSFGESATAGPTASSPGFALNTLLSTGNGTNTASWTSTYTLVAPTGDTSIATGAVATGTTSVVKFYEYNYASEDTYPAYKVEADFRYKIPLKKEAFIKGHGSTIKTHEQELEMRE